VKTSEMIAMLEKNPKLRFVKSTWKDYANLIVDDNKIVLINSKEGYVFARGDRVLVHLDIDADWQLVREPVPVWEAIKAYCEGKKAYCVFKTFGDKEGRFYLQGSDNWGFSGSLLTEGKWYIEDSLDA